MYRKELARYVANCPVWGPDQRRYPFKIECFYGVLRARPLLMGPAMTKTITLSLALAIVAGSIFILHRPITHASEKSSFSDATCGDQYNTLVLKAKQSLARGDRAAAIGGLIEAQNQLRHCEELQERNAKAPSSVALNAF